MSDIDLLDATLDSCEEECAEIDAEVSKILNASGPEAEARLTELTERPKQVLDRLVRIQAALSRGFSGRA
jgi:ElaB/YqjD/DUF883 family membrane-anchored ribosome-binding protein